MDICAIQVALTTLGFEPGPDDGIMGGRTRTAVQAFQRAHHLAVDGLPGLVTQEALTKALAGEKPWPVPLTAKRGVLPFAIGKITRRIDTLVIHCTATQAGRELTRAQLKAMHKARGFADIGYHAFQHLDGTWEIGRPWNTVGAHVEGHNVGSLGVSYVGGVTDPAGKVAKDTRTATQKAGMRDFVEAVLDALPTIRTIKGHRDFSPDRNRNGLVEPSEWIKVCPCFDAAPEFAPLLRR